MDKNVIVHFHIYTVPVTSISTFSPFTSSEMTPLPRSPTASSWDLKSKLSLSSFSHRRPPWGFHWQNLAADFVGDTWRHTDSRVALPELDELCKLSWVETYFPWDCQQGGDAKTQGVHSVRIFFSWSPVAISLWDLCFSLSTCDWVKSYLIYCFIIVSFYNLGVFIVMKYS